MKLLTVFFIASMAMSSFASELINNETQCKKFSVLFEDSDCKYQAHDGSFTALGWYINAGINGTPDECIQQAKEERWTKKMEKVRVLYRDPETCKIVKVQIK